MRAFTINQPQDLSIAHVAFQAADQPPPPIQRHGVSRGNTFDYLLNSHPDRQGRGVVQIQLAHDVRAVDADGPRTQAHTVGDILRDQPPTDLGQDVQYRRNVAKPIGDE